MPSDRHPLTLLVPFPPGGSTHFTATVLADRLATVLGQPVEVVNETGDFGYNAIRALLAGPADRVLLVGNINANSVTPVIRRGEMAIDHWQVARPVTRLAEFPSVVCTYKSFPARTVDELLDHLGRTTGRIRYGTDFLGTYVDVDMIKLSEKAGLGRACMTTDGALGILADLEAERIDLAILNVATATANAARLKALAISGPDRLAQFPDTPTLAEAGFRGIGTSNWQGLIASRRVAEECMTAFHRSVVVAMDDPETRERFTTIGARVVTSVSPAEFEAEIKVEAVEWEKYMATIRETSLLPR